MNASPVKSSSGGWRRRSGESRRYLFVFVGQREVVLHVGLHPPEQVRVDGVPQHAGALERSLHLKHDRTARRGFRIKAKVTCYGTEWD